MPVSWPPPLPRKSGAGRGYTAVAARSNPVLSLMDPRRRVPAQSTKSWFVCFTTGGSIGFNLTEFDLIASLSVYIKKLMQDVLRIPRSDGVQSAAGRLDNPNDLQGVI